MEDFPYEELLQEFEKGAPMRGRILEMGCGSGKLTKLLLPRAREYWALDPSQEMLTLARRRLGAKSGLQLLQEVGDPFPKDLDVILAAVDVMNYMSEEEIRHFFERSRRALKPGGRLLFDLSSAEKLRDQLASNVFFYDEEDFSLIWENHYAPQEEGVWMDLTLFIREGETYRRESETHFQRAWAMGEIRRLLEEAGFRSIDSHTAMDRYFFRVTRE